MFSMRVLWLQSLLLAVVGASIEDSGSEATVIDDSESCEGNAPAASALGARSLLQMKRLSPSETEPKSGESSTWVYTAPPISKRMPFLKTVTSLASRRVACSLEIGKQVPLTNL